MPDIICINTTTSKPTQLDDTSPESTPPVKALSEIVTADAKDIVQSKEVVKAMEAQEIPETGGLMGDPVDAVVAEIPLFTRDLSGFSSKLPVGAAGASQFGTFEIHAVNQLYQDLSTALAQRVIVGMEEQPLNTGNADKAMAHYMTIAIVGFVNRLLFTPVVEGEGDSQIVTGIDVGSKTKDEDGDG